MSEEILEPTSASAPGSPPKPARSHWRGSEATRSLRERSERRREAEAKLQARLQARPAPEV